METLQERNTISAIYESVIKEIDSMEPLDFLKEICHADENDNINYKPYEYSNVVESIPMREAVEKVKKDIEEMKEFLTPYHLEDKAQCAAYKQWRKKLIVY